MTDYLLIIDADIITGTFVTAVSTDVTVTTNNIDIVLIH